MDPNMNVGALVMEMQPLNNTSKQLNMTSIQEMPRSLNNEFQVTPRDSFWNRDTQLWIN